MTDITPALLAEFKHCVPDGVPVPRGIPFIWISRAGTAFPMLDGWQDNHPHLAQGETRWTREPIRPPLPTGLGAVLKDVTTTGGVRWDYAVRSDTSRCPWVAFDRANRGRGVYLADDDLATWTVVSEGVEL